MKKIELTQGKYAMVDDSDYGYVNQWKWHAVNKKGDYYAVRKQYLGTFHGKEKYKTIYMARDIMKTPNDLLCDHENGDTLNNQKRNLRNCTKSENLLNRGPQYNNTSGQKNIFWHGQDKLWRVTFVKLGKKYDVGLFHNIEDAIKARNEAVARVNGEFARTEAFNV